MKAPAILPDEAARLQELRSYRVLDTGADRSFDALTTLAAELLDVPIALVSLVDGDRQWFKSRHGLEVTGTPRDISFCGHVIADGAPLVVKDATKDPRFADNPLVTAEPHIRFYAGVPLRTSNGHDLGTLCAIDRVPRDLSPKQLDALQHLAEVTVAALDAHRRERRLLDERIVADEAARRYEALFEALDEGVSVINREGVISAVNGAAERILDLTVAQMMGVANADPLWRCVYEDGRPFPPEERPPAIALRTNEPQRNVLMGIYKPDGAVVWIRVNSRPLSVAGQEPYAVVNTFHDVTPLHEAMRSQERLRRAERLATMGTLAGGMSHEINNPLTYIISNLEFAKEEIAAVTAEQPSKRLKQLVDALEEAREGARRIHKIVAALKLLASEESIPIAVRPENAVQHASNLAEHVIRSRATFLNEIDPAHVVLADESRLSQILAALLVNAGQSFSSANPGQNRIVIRSRTLADGRVAIDVEDNGPGVPADIEHRIFDPFFTTKPVGKAVGLGLSIGQSLAASMGGEIRHTKAKPSGAIFSLLLPAATIS